MQSYGGENGGGGGGSHCPMCGHAMEGSHQMPDGTTMPGNSHEEYEMAMGGEGGGGDFASAADRLLGRGPMPDPNSEPGYPPGEPSVDPMMQPPAGGDDPMTAELRRVLDALASSGQVQV